jgi:hypothetical protein
MSVVCPSVQTAGAFKPTLGHVRKIALARRPVGHHRRDGGLPAGPHRLINKGQVLKALVAVTLVLGGCAANPDLDRRYAEYGPYCERLGILSGTMGFGECVMWQEMVDVEQQKARAQRAPGPSSSK